MKVSLLSKVGIIAALGAVAACGGMDQGVSTLAERTQPGLELAFGAPELLGVIGGTQDGQPMRLPAGVRSEQVEAAFNAMNAKLKPKDDAPGQLQVDETFARGLNAVQRQGLQKVSHGYSQKHQDGSIKVRRGNGGSWSVEPGDGRNANRGQGRDGESFDHVDAQDDGAITPEHRVGDGYWSWSSSYRWWGVKISANHNFLWYLCSYTSWILDRSGLPSWIKAVLRLLLCAPHNADGSYDGAAIYITWAGVFWYSA